MDFECRDYSDELDAAWTFAVQAGRLTARVLNHSPTPFSPLKTDWFVGDSGMVLRFERESGTLRPVYVQAGSVTNLLFERRQFLGGNATLFPYWRCPIIRFLRQWGQYNQAPFPRRVSLPPTREPQPPGSIRKGLRPFGISCHRSHILGFVQCSGLSHLTGAGAAVMAVWLGLRSRGICPNGHRRMSRADRRFPSSIAPTPSEEFSL